MLETCTVKSFSFFVFYWDFTVTPLPLIAANAPLRVTEIFRADPESHPISLRYPSWTLSYPGG